MERCLVIPSLLNLVSQWRLIELVEYVHLVNNDTCREVWVLDGGIEEFFNILGEVGGFFVVVTHRLRSEHFKGLLLVRIFNWVCFLVAALGCVKEFGSIFGIIKDDVLLENHSLMDATVLGNHGIPFDLHFAKEVTLAAIYDIIIGLVL